MEEMSTKLLSINYDGPALECGEMAVEDLAPALLAMGKLFEEANRVINGEKSNLSVRVRAGFVRGSFEVELHLLQGWVSYAKDLLVGQDATALAALCAFLGISGKDVTIGLFKLLKLARGRQPKRAHILEDGNVELEFPYEDGEENKIIAPRQTVALFRDLKVRKAAAAAIKPLEKEGINTISVRQTGEKKEKAEAVVSKADIISFRPPESVDSLIISSPSTVAFSIVNLSFDADHKWKLSDGQNVVWASIEDETFINSVNRNEVSFTKGDILVCDVVVQQWQTDTGLKTETRIIKVKQHRHPSMRQIDLPFE
ncbi:hypothetical protein APO_0646 [Acetobacter orientalis]|uniref:Uncharacterized protein n=1 Tax=Acetobacter orientalis TaxID=146474 RepID=A0A2Z5ZKG3_9PROT|nr:hypothetical protein APO_0646 [Acetobacter orientalis]